MTATNKTANYELPLFAESDQPTWLGDFNGAMNKIDGDLGQIGANASTAISAANNAVARVGTVETQITAIQTTANNAISLAQTNEQDIGTLDGQVAQLENKFPVTSASLSNGAVTAAKLDQTAIAAIWSGLTVHRFDSADSTADNTGMVAPAGSKFAGFYVEEMGLLVVNKMENTYRTESDALFTLPSYVPNNAVTGLATSGSFLVWNSSSNFVTWSGLYTLKSTRQMRISTYPSIGNSFSLFGSAVLFMGLNTGKSASTQGAYQAMNPTVG